jgi:iron complex outermembrane receptor protein
LIAGLPTVMTSPSLASAGEMTDEPPATSEREIVIYGLSPRANVLAGLRAEAELDENGIAAYGLDTVGDLIGEVLRRVDPSGDGPVVLINGQPATGLSEISDLPSEAVSRIQLLPPQAAGLLGERPTRRVVNIVVRPDHRQVTVRATGSFATAGDGLGAEGEINLLRLSNGNRRSLVLRARHADPLYEADRNIIGTAAGTSYDFAGNVLAFPLIGAEIDPALSAIAGELVTIAGVPIGSVNPSLADFAVRANDPNVSDIGRYRTLLPRQEVYTANANLTQKYGSRTTLSVNLTGEHSRSHGLLGAAPLDLRLPATSPFSPFGQDVTVARYLDAPLRQDQEITSLAAATIVNSQIGRWRISFNSNFAHRVGITRSDRGADPGDLQAAIDAGTLNPFAPFPADLAGPFSSDRSRIRSDIGSAVLTASGSPFSLPAGPANASLRLEWRFNRNLSTTVGDSFVLERRLRRNDAVARLTLQLPLLGAATGTAIGDLNLELSGALRKVTASGGLEDYGYGLNWQPSASLTLRAAINNEQIAPPPNSLTDPVIVTEGFRAFDFIREETVLIRFITGGNPDLDVEKRRTITIGGTWRPPAASDLSLNAEYSRIRGRDVFAVLPPASADVQAAFPDRFQRDADGRLIAIDARLVPFSRVEREQFRWGVDFVRSFGGRPSPPVGAGGDREDALVPGWRVNAYANHNWALSYTRLARPGLPVVDLLAGGAIGYGGGQPRHNILFGGGVARRGFGLQLNGNWIGPSRITAGTAAAPSEIFFASRMRADGRFFVNLGPQFPDISLARGARIAIEVENIFDSRQRVRDEAGAVPLRYQPFLLDPLGRVVRISLRKVF